MQGKTSDQKQTGITSTSLTHSHYRNNPKDPVSQAIHYLIVTKLIVNVILILKMKSYWI